MLLEVEMCRKFDAGGTLPVRDGHVRRINNAESWASFCVRFVTPP